MLNRDCFNKRICNIFFMILIIFFNTTILAQKQDTLDQIWLDIDDHFRKRLEENYIVGGSLMFAEGDGVNGESFYGFADVDLCRIVDKNTIYHWASITKTFTAIAIMQLRDRGLLDLDDPVIDVIPELRHVHNPFGTMDEITIRHLLTHSAGFRGPTWPWGGDKDWQPYEPTQWSQLVAMIPYTEILFKPGSRYSYSNPGIIFLGRIIEILSGDDYEVYIDKNILKPLQMYHTYFDVTPYHLLPYRSNNYYIQEGDITANGLDFDTGITVSNGGLNAPLTDMVKYLVFLTGGNDSKNQILKRSSLEEMWKPQIVIDDNNNLKQSIGLSFFILEQNGIRAIGHTGSQKGFMSFFYFDPAREISAICIFNTSDIEESGGSNTRKLSDGIRDLLFERIWPLYTPDN